MSIGIGIDVGGTFVKFFAVDEKGKMINQSRLETSLENGPAKFMSDIAAQINEWKKLYGGRIAMCVAMPGDVDNKKGVLRFGTNLKYKGKNVKNLKVADILKKLTGVKPLVVNDATIAAWGAYELEKAKKFENVMIVTMGTGIGGGLILNGDLYQGSHGVAGEIGHIRIDRSRTAPVCGCGNRGCVEAFAGSYGIRRMVREEIILHPASKLAKAVNNTKRHFNIDIVYETAKAGCASAKHVWKEVGRALGIAISNGCMILDLDMVIITGGVSGAAEFFMPELRRVLDEQHIRTPFDNLKIIISNKKNLGGLGAALYSIASNKSLNEKKKK
ncbi:glucokinase [Parelusimicrobium proximum]|uniref:ROK family protein n=1 Tax=Parelusimicrobium proximum TaxID=3228953 RepID=UPI003D16B740